MNIYLIIIEGKYDAIDNDDFSCYSYYIIKFSSFPYTLQEDLSIDKKVIYSGEMVWEGTNFLPVNIDSHYYVLQRTKSINTSFSLKKIINGNVNVIC